MMKNLAICFVGLILIGVSVAVSMVVWDECRASGHSVVYCVRMMSR